MPEAMEVFIKSTKTRIFYGCVGLCQIVGAAFLVQSRAYSDPIWRWVALVFTLLWAYYGVISVIWALWGGFPAWSHALMTEAKRAKYAQAFKAQATIPATTYKWGSSLQVFAVELALVLLVGWLSTLVGPLVAVFGPKVWLGGGAIGGLLAFVLNRFLRR
jgi:hypothetical protein